MWSRELLWAIRGSVVALVCLFVLSLAALPDVNTVEPNFHSGQWREISSPTLEIIQLHKDGKVVNCWWGTRRSYQEEEQGNKKVRRYGVELSVNTSDNAPISQSWGLNQATWLTRLRVAQGISQVWQHGPIGSSIKMGQIVPENQESDPKLVLRIVDPEGHFVASRIIPDEFYPLSSICRPIP